MLNGEPDLPHDSLLVPPADNLEILSPQEPWEDPRIMGPAYASWLERRNIVAASLPRFTVQPKDFNSFMSVPKEEITEKRHALGIPWDVEFVFIDIPAESPDTPSGIVLVDATERDFGTVIDSAGIALDFEKTPPDPQHPAPPDLVHGALIVVNIAETLGKSEQALHTFARQLMRGETRDPFRKYSGGDTGIRAGGISPGQQDAFVWEYSPFRNAVALTVAFPSTYSSVCVVRGQKKAPINGKSRMAQIETPGVVLEISGDNLENLKKIYHQLYSQPDFALTASQRQERDDLFEGLAGQIPRATVENEQEESRARRRRAQAHLARQIPH